MKLLCKLGLHDWKLSASGDHMFTGYDEFGDVEIRRLETGWHGYQCRSCARRSIKKAGGFGGLFDKKVCAAGPWEEAIGWQKEEVIQ